MDLSRTYNYEQVVQATTLLLKGLGQDLADDNIKETPVRVAKMYEILIGGYDIDPVSYLKMFPAKSNDMVSLTNIPFYSFCSHHLLPFVGKLHIAYIPDGQVVGLSKLVRFSRIYAKRLNLQEDLTQNIADELMHSLKAQGVMVRVEAQHFCTILRGVRAHGAVMTTTAKRGVFNTDNSIREEFNDCIRREGSFAY